MSKKQLITGLVILSFIVILLSPFRYKVTGTNKGYLYKTDRLTGKTHVVTPNGEITIGKYVSPTSTPTPEKISGLYFEIISVNNRNIGYSSFADVVIRNNSGKSVNQINLKVEYTEKENSPVIDTDYPVKFETILKGDTKTITVPLTDSSKQYWYRVLVDSAL